jgi:hypothetical protein
VLCFSFIALTHLLEEWNFVHFIRLGFWNVTNPWKNERRKSTEFSTLFCKNSSCHSYNYEWKSQDIDDFIFNVIVSDIQRQTAELVQCVGWLLNQLHIENTVKHQIFGHLELLVSVHQSIFQVNSELSYQRIKNALWNKCFCFLFLLVYEIVAQREPHKDKDMFEVGLAIR